MIEFFCLFFEIVFLIFFIYRNYYSRKSIFIINNSIHSKVYFSLNVFFKNIGIDTLNNLIEICEYQKNVNCKYYILLENCDINNLNDKLLVFIKKGKVALYNNINEYTKDIEYLNANSKNFNLEINKFFYPKSENQFYNLFDFKIKNRVNSLNFFLIFEHKKGLFYKVLRVIYFFMMNNNKLQTPLIILNNSNKSILQTNQIFFRSVDNYLFKNLELVKHDFLSIKNSDLFTKLINTTIYIIFYFVLWYWSSYLEFNLSILVIFIANVFFEMIHYYKIEKIINLKRKNFFFISVFNFLLKPLFFLFLVYIFVLKIFWKDNE